VPARRARLIDTTAKPRHDRPPTCRRWADC
jgi:hypothetical protein